MSAILLLFLIVLMGMEKVIFKSLAGSWRRRRKGGN
jgi:hypothetical protein